MIQRIAARAGVDLTPAACWLLSRIARDPAADVPSLATQYHIDLQRLASGLDALTSGGLIAGPPGQRTVTAEGRRVLDKLYEARRQGVAEMLSEFAPERHAELAEFIDRIAQQVNDRAPAA